MLTERDVVRFWLPLSATWLMMAAEGPILTSVVARLPMPAINLAAYGVAVALAMFIEAPVIHLLSTSVSLSRDRRSFARIRTFMWWLNAWVTFGMIVVTIPQIYDVLAVNIISLPKQVSETMYAGLVCMIPWPAAIGYRRFYQGLLIRAGLTRRVAYGTVIRLSTMLLAATTLVSLGNYGGVVIGTLSLSVGVICEAIATRLMAGSTIRRLEQGTDEPPTYGEITRFHVPLALTSIMGFVVTPMIAFFLGRAPMAVESLAVLPVVDSLVFLFRSLGFSYQEVGIALMGEKRKNYDVLRRVGKNIIIGTTIALGLLAFTPLADIVYRHVYGLSDRLVDVALLPTQILTLLPALAVLYSLQRAVLITARRNVAVTWSTITEVGFIALVMAALVPFAPWNGAISAAIAMVVGRVLANVYLRRSVLALGPIPTQRNSTGNA